MPVIVISSNQQLISSKLDFATAGVGSWEPKLWLLWPHLGQNALVPYIYASKLLHLLLVVSCENFCSAMAAGGAL